MSNQIRKTYNRLNEKSLNCDLHESFRRNIYIKTNYLNFVKH